MKVSFIATVYNEEKTVDLLIDSLLSQTKKPDEIIIVDGGSTDATVSIISNFIRQLGGSNQQIKFKFLIKKGNRAVGRNTAVKPARGDIILCSDAGCILDKDWVKNITAPFRNPKVDIVAGFYKGAPKNIFEKCLVPYVLVMPGKINPHTFLPASRSMAFRKSVWEKAGGFPENFSHNEDYIFAQKLKQMKAKIVFAKEAVVYWLPRKNLQEAFNMFYRFALGDMEAGIIRPRVILLFARYLVGIAILIAYLVTESNLLLTTCYVLLVMYLMWSIGKNYRYVNDFRAIFYLPLIQFSCDFAVISGSLKGIITKR